MPESTSPDIVGIGIGLLAMVIVGFFLWAPCLVKGSRPWKWGMRMCAIVTFAWGLHWFWTLATAGMMSVETSMVPIIAMSIAFVFIGWYNLRLNDRAFKDQAVHDQWLKDRERTAEWLRDDS